jgi:hypothetical protein
MSNRTNRRRKIVPHRINPVNAAAARFAVEIPSAVGKRLIHLQEVEINGIRVKTDPRFRKEMSESKKQDSQLEAEAS